MLHILWLFRELKPTHRSLLIVFTLSGMSSIILEICLNALHLEKTLTQDDCGSRV